MSTASDTAPAAQGSLERGADRKIRAVALCAAGKSQHEVARMFGVTQTTVWRWCHELGVERAAPTPEELVELSIGQAVRIGPEGIGTDAILAAVEDGRLSAHKGKPEFSYGKPGRRTKWLIRRTDFDDFIAALEPCRYQDCDRLGHTRDGCCGRAHSIAMTGKRLSSEERRASLAAYYSSPASEELRALRAEAMKEAWATGEPRVRALLDREDGRRPKGTVRRIYKLKWAPKPGRRRLDERHDYEETLKRIRSTYDETHASERDLERLTGESRRMIRTALGRPL
jgi:Homeodomain-like domain